ncbi:hypothetical protein GCM10012275_22040 [Longimycelium tulufanense]|uniref:Uncharacterized protein n=1 Tax=Longimycelium tulufanense TaxID=907463 RepID=A0A8J3FTN0_9PSEU|nr:hypothetical protein [Longimycelium tulufanense]GGM50770.1 hypothetical protein GCM10012275_22040 [Longimycelium tulufanense]
MARKKLLAVAGGVFVTIALGATLVIKAPMGQVEVDPAAAKSAETVENTSTARATQEHAKQKVAAAQSGHDMGAAPKAANDGDKSAKGKLLGTGSGKVYPDPVDGRTFDRYDGEWTQQRGNKVCALVVSCATSDGFWFFQGTNGMLRTQVSGSKEAGGTLTHTWSSPKFTYRGNDGKAPEENVVQYRFRAATDRFAESELANGNFKVQVVDAAGNVVAENSGRELIPGKDWKATRFSVPASALKIGETYQLRAVTQIAKEGRRDSGGTVDWDCVALTARSGDMTGTEGCGGGDTPPDPGEFVMGGGSSPVCNSVLDPLMGPLYATLKQVLDGPNKEAARAGMTTADLVNELLAPGRPLAVALGDLTGTFAATTSGELSGPGAQLAQQLQPFTEAVAKATNPATSALNGALTPLAKILSDAAGNVTKPAGELLAGLLSPAGHLAAPLIPVYDSMVRPITQPFVSTVMNNAKPAMVAALGPEGTKAAGNILQPLEEAARGTAGPFTAAIGTLHPVHATIVNLLDPIYTSYLTTLGPDAEQYTKFVRSAYVHSFKGYCGDSGKPAPESEHGHN